MISIKSYYIAIPLH